MQAQVQRLEATQVASQAEQELRRQAKEKRLQDLYVFMVNLQATTGIAVPPSLLVPVLRTPEPSPVSMVVYCFSLCDPPAETHEFAFPLRSHRPRVRTRLLKGTTRCIQVNLALLHSSGGQLALLHSPGARWPFFTLRVARVAVGTLDWSLFLCFMDLDLCWIL